jgi:hypothetical protein
MKSMVIFQRLRNCCDCSHDIYGKIHLTQNYVLYFIESSVENIIYSGKYFVNFFQKIYTNIYRNTCKAVTEMGKCIFKLSYSFP